MVIGTKKRILILCFQWSMAHSRKLSCTGKGQLIKDTSHSLLECCILLALSSQDIWWLQKPASSSDLLHIQHVTQVIVVCCSFLFSLFFLPHPFSLSLNETGPQSAQAGLELLHPSCLGLPSATSITMPRNRHFLLTDIYPHF